MTLKKPYASPVVTTAVTPPQIQLCSPTKPFDCDIQAGGGVCPGVCGASVAQCDIICPPF